MSHAASFSELMFPKDPHCAKESGFEVEIDSTELPDGPGRLTLVSTTEYGWQGSSVVTWSEGKGRKRFS